MTLNDNAIDYMYWDDLNELVDCSKLRAKLVTRCYQSLRNFVRLVLL